MRNIAGKQFSTDWLFDICDYAFKIKLSSLGFFSLGIFSCLSAGKGTVNDRVIVSGVFIKINHKGRKVKEVEGLFKRVLMVDNCRI